MRVPIRLEPTGQGSVLEQTKRPMLINLEPVPVLRLLDSLSRGRTQKGKHEGCVWNRAFKVGQP
jgi:hypothetical protein